MKKRRKRSKIYKEKEDEEKEDEEKGEKRIGKRVGLMMRWRRSNKRRKRRKGGEGKQQCRILDINLMAQNEKMV